VLNRGGDWKTFPPAYLRTHGIWPNQLRYNASTGEGELVAQQSKWNEFALSQVGLEYLQRALQEGKITQAYVALENRQGQQVARKPVSEVVATVEKIPPRNGTLGPYWWFLSDLTPQDASDIDAIPY
jgi:hypothetical protein